MMGQVFTLPEKNVFEDTYVSSLEDIDSISLFDSKEDARVVVQVPSFESKAQQVLPVLSPTIGFRLDRLHCYMSTRIGGNPFLKGPVVEYWDPVVEVTSVPTLIAQNTSSKVTVDKRLKYPLELEATERMLGERVLELGKRDLDV